MEKIFSMFKRDYETIYQIYDDVVSGAEWVLSGEGHATQKGVGTCCMIGKGWLYKRYKLRGGKTVLPGL